MVYIKTTSVLPSPHDIDGEYCINDLVMKNHKYLIDLIKTLEEDSFTNIENLDRKSYYVTAYCYDFFNYLTSEEEFIVLLKNRLLLPELLKRTNNA